MLSRQDFFAMAKGRLSVEELYSAYEAYVTCPALRERGAFQCKRCGSCCRRPWRIEPSVDDVRRWISEKRLDIIENLVYAPKRGPPQGLTPLEAEALEAMCSDDEYTAATFAFALAASAESALIVAKDLEICSYYDGFGCAIYDTRPGVCARFPESRLFEGLAALVQ